MPFLPLLRSCVDPATVLLRAGRFLKARDYDVEVALQFFRDDFIWREARQLNEIVQTGGGAVPKLFAEFRVPELQELKAVRMITFHKTDRLGQPIAYDRPTHATIREMHKVTSLERLMEYAVWFQEATVVYRLPAASLAAGRLVTQITVIIDVSGFALKNFNAEMRAVLKALTSISANHYPETMQRTFIVNAPLAFRVVWRFLKIILPPKVVEAIRICGGPHDYLPVLERDVCNRSQIPTFLGGDDASFVDFAHEIGPWAEHLPKLV